MGISDRVSDGVRLKSQRGLPEVRTDPVKIELIWAKKMQKRLLVVVVERDR